MNAEPRRGLGRRRRGTPHGLVAMLTLLTALVAGSPVIALAQGADESPSPQPAASARPASPAASSSPASPAASSVPAAADAGPPFPSTLAGVPLEVETYRGRRWLAEFEGNAEGAVFAEGTTALLDSVGKDIDDLTVRSALVQPSEGNQAVILALRIDGAEARDFAIPAVRLLLGDVNEPEFALRPLADRWVLRVSDAAVPGVYPRTVYLDADTAWIIGADEPYLLELLEQLPTPSYPGVPAAEVLAAQLPVALDGRRRTGLYEAREPVFLPALSFRLGPALDEWMLDLYLSTGHSPTDLVGAVAWWGIAAPEESVEVEGYQVPGGSAELVERLRSEVFLLGGEALPDEISRIDQELGGRQVTTLELASANEAVSAKQHIFSSGDTVWVVTDHAGEPAMAEEAIAALP